MKKEGERKTEKEESKEHTRKMAKKQERRGGWQSYSGEEKQE